jgi:hypothetical protein
MESVYHIVTIRVNETSWAHVWRIRSRYLGTGYDKGASTIDTRFVLKVWPITKVAYVSVEEFTKS